MKNDSQAIILAAGRGSRMGIKTKYSHKCLTVLNGKTLLNWQIGALSKAGITDIVVVRGYRSEMLIGDFQTAENPRWAKTNMVTTLFCAPKIEHDTIISYSDIVYKSQHIKNLIKKKGDIVITADKDWYSLWSSRFINPLEDAETFQTDGDTLIRIGQKNSSLENITAQYMGLVKFSPKGWNIANSIYKGLKKNLQDQLDMTSFLSILIKNSISIKVSFVNGGWCEIDSYEDVILYEKLLKKKSWSHDWRENYK